MLTNTFITCFFILLLTFSLVHARNDNDIRRRLRRETSRELIPKRIEKNSDRLKREFNPQSSPLNTVRSSLQWRPNSQQPQGQVYK